MKRFAFKSWGSNRLLRRQMPKTARTHQGRRTAWKWAAFTAFAAGLLPASWQHSVSILRSRLPVTIVLLLVAGGAVGMVAPWQHWVHRARSSTWPPAESDGVVAVSSTASLPLSPHVVVAPDGAPHLAWMEYADHASRLFTRRQAGATWKPGPPGFATTGPALLSDTAFAPDSRLHVLYLRREGGVQQVVHRVQSSSDWSAPEVLMEGPLPAYSPRLAIDARGRLHAAWYVVEEHHSGVLYREWNDGRWSDIERVAVPSQSATFWGPDLAAAADGTVHLVYFSISPQGAAVEYRRRDSSGWAPPVVLSHGQKFAVSPDIAVDGSGVPHTVWVGGPQSHAITYDVVERGRWRPPEVISHREATPRSPTVVVDASGTVYVSWIEQSPGGQAAVFLTRTTNGRWAVPVKVSQEKGTAYAKDASISNDTLYLALSERTSDHGGRIRLLQVGLAPLRGRGT